MKTDVEAVFDNLVLAQQRRKSSRKKAMKDEDLRVFLSESFRELQNLNYIELVNESKAVGNSVWYLPCFVISQAKNRIVYDGRANLNSVCINNFI